MIPRSALSLILLIVMGCGASPPTSKTAPAPVELGDEDKVDLFGRAVQTGGTLHYDETVNPTLWAESYLELRFVATGSARVSLDVNAQRDSSCESTCSECWLVDPVLQVDGPFVDGAFTEGVHVVGDDRGPCDLDPHLELDVDRGTYRVLVWDYQFRSGAVMVTLSCLAGDCAAACDDGCPEGSACIDAICEPTTESPSTATGDGDILVTRLEIDDATQSGLATIEVIPNSRAMVTLEVGGLEIRSVSSPSGPIEHLIEDGRLQATFTESVEPLTLVIDYGYQHQSELEGATATGLTMTWPYYCGNLFPCQSSPDEGSRFELALTGIPAGETAVYPTEIPSDAPAYMLAWAIGNYGYTELGRTASGTRIGVYNPPELTSDALAATTHLAAAFEWLETTLGPYIFGAEAASVSAAWGAGAYGGMEHHPFWHISQADFTSEETHCHEAAHGWFGNGVRIRCWEDFVLSEGTTSYLTVRALEAVAGEATAERIWADYRRRLDYAQTSARMKIAWPDSCGTVDILTDGLFSSIPYMKGAFFFKALEGRVGRDALDAALATFYTANRGRAAGMDDLLDTIASETGYNPTDCAVAWLRSETLPTSEVCGD